MDRAAAWERNRARLVAHLAENGSWPSRHGAEPQLAAWLTYQRRRWRGGRMTDREARSLDSIPGWSWSPRADHGAQMGRLYVLALVARSTPPRVRSTGGERVLALWWDGLGRRVRTGRATYLDVRRYQLISRLRASALARTQRRSDSGESS